MTSILVVDDDPPLRRALVRDLRANGYEAFAASGYDEALGLVQERPYDVLVTDLRMGARDGLDLILALSGTAPEIRPIMMSAYATAHDTERAMALGAVRVLCKPFESEQLIQAVERAVQSARSFAGSVHGLSLVDLLQMYHFARRSVTLHLRGRGSSVSLREGELVDARHGDLVGPDALRAILAISAGVVETTELQAKDHTVFGRFETTLLEALRRNDEHGARSAFPADAAIDTLGGVSERETRGRGLGAPSRVGESTEGTAGRVMPGAGEGGRSGAKPRDASGADVPAAQAEQERPPASAVDELGRACQRVVDSVSGVIFCGVVDRRSHCVLSARSERDADPPSSLASSPAADALDHFDEVHGFSGDELHLARRIGDHGAAVLVVMRDAVGLAAAREQLLCSEAELEAALARRPG